MLKAGTPEKIDQDPIGTGPFPRAISEGRGDPLQGGVLGRQGQDRRPRLRDHPGCLRPLGQLQKGECHVMPYPTRRTWSDEEGSERHDPRSARPEHRLSRLQHHEEALRRARPQGDEHGHQQEGHHRRGVSLGGVAGEEPDPAVHVVLQRRREDDPYDPDSAKKLLAEAGFPNGLETDLWAMPVQRPTTPMPSASRS